MFSLEMLLHVANPGEFLCAAIAVFYWVHFEIGAGKQYPGRFIWGTIDSLARRFRKAVLVGIIIIFCRTMPLPGWS
jgi:hypothetical protein